MLGGRNPNNPSLISSQSRFSRWGVVCNRSALLHYGHYITEFPTEAVLVTLTTVACGSLDDYNRLVTLCNGTNEGFIQRGIMEAENVSLPDMNDVRSCLGIRDFDSPPYFTNSSFSFRYSLT